MALFGAFLFLTDWFVPLGVSVFGLPISIAGVIMVVVGFFRAEPQPVEPKAGKKFCWYCMAEIPKAAAECPACSLPQHEAKT